MTISQRATDPEPRPGALGGNGARLRADDPRGRSDAVLRQIEASAAADADAAKLARRAQHADALAFAELYQMFSERVRRYLLIALKNADDAQEATQDVFAHVLKALDRFDPARGEFRDWLFSIARNTAIDRLRRRSRADEVDLSAVPTEALPLADRAVSLLERLDPGGGARSIIEALPEAQRRVLALRFVFGLSTAEIARVTGSTQDAVRHIQHRALKALEAAGVSRVSRRRSSET